MFGVPVANLLFSCFVVQVDERQTVRPICEISARRWLTLVVKEWYSVDMRTSPPKMTCNIVFQCLPAKRIHIFGTLYWIWDFLSNALYNCVWAGFTDRCEDHVDFYKQMLLLAAECHQITQSCPHLAFDIAIQHLDSLFKSLFDWNWYPKKYETWHISIVAHHWVK